MATIYDVAKEASVSPSTVSNYINNKYVGPKSKAAIEAAIVKLKYVPNRNAQSLKNRISKRVALILPNIQEQLYSEIYTGIYHKLQENSYLIDLYLTDDIPYEETQILSQCLSNPIAGIILCTCDPSNSGGFIKLSNHAPLVFIERKPLKLSSYNFVGFNNYKSMSKVLDFLFQSKIFDIHMITGPHAYSSEKECLIALQNTCRKHNVPFSSDMYSMIPVSIFSALQNLIAILDQNPPAFFITSSMVFAQALIAASNYQNIKVNEDVHILSLGEESVFNLIDSQKIIYTERRAQFLGIQTASLLLSTIRSKGYSESKVIHLDDNFPYYKLKDITYNRKKSSVTKKSEAKKNLRILMVEEDNSTNVVKYLLKAFQENHEINIELVQLHHRQIYDQFKDIISNQNDQFDILSFDAPWLPYLASKSSLVPLNKHLNLSYYKNILIKNSLEQYSTYDHSIYGIPYLHGTQILFYRKDLFEDPYYASAFFKKYKKKLEAPKTWFDYELIARFFTKKFNPDSPLQYGTTISSNHEEVLTGEFFPRLWAYDGDVFDIDGHVSINSDNAKAAYTNLIKCIECSPPDVAEKTCFDNAKHFASGNSAIVMLYHNHASIITDRTFSKVIGKVGFASIPGKSPILAGWCLGINRYSNHIKTSLNFFDWFFSAQISMPYAILAGTSMKSSIYTNPELNKLYPWFKTALSDFNYLRRRNSTVTQTHPEISQIEIEKALAHIVTNYMKDRIPLNQLLTGLENDLEQIIANSGIKTL